MVIIEYERVKAEEEIKYSKSQRSSSSFSGFGNSDYGSSGGWSSSSSSSSSGFSSSSSSGGGGGGGGGGHSTTNSY